MNLGAGLPHLVYFGAILPYRAWVNRGHWRSAEAAPRPSRADKYKANLNWFGTWTAMSLSTTALLWVLSSRQAGPAQIFVLNHAVERPADVWTGLLSPAWPSLWHFLLAVLAYAAMAAIDLAYSRKCFDRGDARMYYDSPETTNERRLWMLMSIAAGVSEELTWRGVQPELIAQAAGSLWPAIAICAVTFGVGHIRMGKPFVFIAALFALIFHALAWATGGLYLPILVHIGVNLTVGLRAGRWTRA
jgi:membrane protease YdiL (CAAX protease family)